MKTKEFLKDLVSKIQPGVFIPIQVIESLVILIDYTYHDEEEHYLECEEEHRDNHIFPHIVILYKWVEHLKNGSPSLEQHEMSNSEINSQQNDHDYVLGLIQKCKEGEE